MTSSAHQPETGQIRDSGCDALALLRLRFDMDTESQRIVLEHCDLRAVVSFLVVQYVALALSRFGTEEGARQHLDHLTKVWVEMPW